MRIGLQLPSFCLAEGPTGIAPRLREIAQAADEGGFSSLWVMDHYFQIPVVGPADQEMLEGYGTLSFLAAATSRLKLGALVTGVTFRHPGLLVKSVSTLDVLSGGRAYLGIGAAWFDREHRGLGVPFPALGERFERLEEALQIAKQMWSPDNSPYEGRHYRLAETLNVPQPLSKPHPPILIGGLGERKTLRLVAQYGDACNLFTTIGASELRRKLDILKRHCDDVDRPYEEVEKTSLSVIQAQPGAMRPEEVVASCRELSDIGIQHAIFALLDLNEVSTVEALGREVIPEVAAL